jgi:hypothetical protein
MKMKMVCLAPIANFGQKPEARSQKPEARSQKPEASERRALSKIV